MSQRPYNPYRDPPPTPGVVEHEEVRTVITVDGTTGERQVAGASTESVAVNRSGGRWFDGTIAVLRTTDGNLVKDALLQGVYACTRCRTSPWSIQAVVACVHCSKVLCKDCAKFRRDIAWCPPCWRRHILREIVEAVIGCR